ncbi:hypothetical protein PG994_008934 [Apiospora phragmitis]|uniref:Uncharacterized protein n=1 Tax=Apiospora phragmitis TaxID=2905665 RepID=A0ABR1UHU1_9PEZI
MAFSSANVESLTMGMQGVAVGAADRCIPFLANEVTGLNIKDPQDAFDDLLMENLARRSPSLGNEMDWEETHTINHYETSPIPTTTAKVNPFLDAKAVAKPVNPFGDVAAVKPVNPFLVPAASRLPEAMDIDDWSINTDDQTNNFANNKARLAHKRNNRGNQRNNQRQSNSGNGNTTRSHNGGSNGTSNKHNGGGVVGFLDNHTITKAFGSQHNKESRSETRRGGNSRRRSNGNKNRSQRQ